MKRLRLDWIDYRGDGSTIESFISSSKAELFGWEIFFNQPIEEAEAWFVIEGSAIDVQKTKIPSGMLFFGSGDTIWSPEFYNASAWRLKYLKQFNRIYSCHNISLPNSEDAIPFHHWMVNANTGTNVLSKHLRDFDFLSGFQPPEKKRELSVICSTKSFTPDHAQRLEFVKALKAHFGDRMDWFGNGIAPLTEKWDGLVDYKFTIAIENKVRDNVITEKILDPFLTYTLPIYYGAPNVNEYFDENAFLSINLKNLPESIEKIEQLLSEDVYASRLEVISGQRNKVLNDYNFIQRIIKIVEKEYSNYGQNEFESVTVFPMSSYQPLKSRLEDVLKSKIARTRRRFTT